MYTSPGRINLRIEDIKNIDSLNVLFLGSSHVFMGFDTRIFNKYNLTAFNFGSLAQTPIQTKYLYEKYAKDIVVDLIVFEVNPEIFTSDGVESTIDIINSENLDYSIFNLCLKTEHPKCWNTLVFKWIQKIMGCKIVPPELGSYIKGSGYAPTNACNEKPRQRFNKKYYPVNKNQILAFQDMIELWHNQNIDVVLVQAPVTKNFYWSHLGAPIFDTIMNKYGRYYNFNELIKLNDSSDFADYHHLNQNGTDIFNEALIKILIEEKIINN